MDTPRHDPRGRHPRPQTGQRLTAALSRLRRQLRKDASNSSAADALSQLAWLLFLRCIDAAEGESGSPAGDPLAADLAFPNRWRDWASPGGALHHLNGDPLLAFVNSQLVPYLSSLEVRDPRSLRAVIASIFRHNPNRFRAGTVLRGVTDILDDLQLTGNDDLYGVSLLYETLLADLGRAARDSGEFYTPRPVARFMINRLAPQSGEFLLDPACGTAGFLVEAFASLGHRNEVDATLMGIEKRSTPYLLGIMNLLLHGVRHPNLAQGNALSGSLQDLFGVEQVHIIAMNPPFGGLEEGSIVESFGASPRTSETSLLFLQLALRTLKYPGGRAGIVVPNGFLSSGGAAREIRRQLLSTCNLHTIVRLPGGVFAPHTSIPTNLLFFETCGRNSPGTRAVWYYQLSPPGGRKAFSQTVPLRIEDFADCLAWWDGRHRLTNTCAWRVPISAIAEVGWDLNRSTPFLPRDASPPDTAALTSSLLQKERRILDFLQEIQRSLGAAG